MQVRSQDFFKFTGFHSALIGLLPFFLPVILWQQGYNLSEICIFISLTGVGFIATLWGWDRLRERNSWKTIIAASFGLELLLVALIATTPTSFFIILLALLNGAYNCFYWSSQRAMLSNISSSKDSGKTYGNFQILVVVLLKLGILAGGIIIEEVGLWAIAALTAITSVIAIASFGIFTKSKDSLQQPSLDDSSKALTFKDIIGFKDNNRSRLTFLLDGPFLYLESYFWVLSVYLITDESPSKLALVVVILALLLSALFFVIKNKIDQADQRLCFQLALILYSASWLLRSYTSTESSEFILYSLLIVIGFFTSFFRLVFNKRFYDLAEQTATYQYLIIKSYYSQFGIVLFFGALGWLLNSSASIESLLSNTYLWIAPFALGFVFYRPRNATIHLTHKFTRTGNA